MAADPQRGMARAASFLSPQVEVEDRVVAGERHPGGPEADPRRCAARVASVAPTRWIPRDKPVAEILQAERVLKEYLEIGAVLEVQ